MNYSFNYVFLFTSSLFLSLAAPGFHLLRDNNFLTVAAQTVTTTNQKTQADKLFNKGVELHRRGQYYRALEIYQQVLKTRRQQGDKAGIAQTLNKIGQAYITLGENDKANPVLQEALTIYKELKDRKGEGEALHNISSVYAGKSQYNQALEILQEALTIRREVKDRKGEAKTLRRIGWVRGIDLGKRAEGIKVLQEALKIQEEIGDEYQASVTLMGIGWIYYFSKDYPRALEFLEKAQLLSLKANNPIAAVISLQLTASVYSNQGDEKRYVEVLEKALVFARKNQLRDHQLGILNLLVGSYVNNLNNNHTRVKDLAQEAVNLARELNKQSEEVEALYLLGNIYIDLRNDQKAEAILLQVVKITREIKDLDTESAALVSLNDIYTRRGYTQKVIDNHLRGLEIAKKQDSKWQKYSVLMALGNVYIGTGQYQKALETSQKSLAVLEQIEISKLPPHRKIEFTQTQVSVLKIISWSYKHLGQYDKTLDFAQQMLKKAESFNNPKLEIQALIHLASIYDNPFNNLSEAVELSQKALSIAQKNKELTTEVDVLLNLSRFYNKQRKYDLALKSTEKALVVAKKLKNPESEHKTLSKLSDIYHKQGRYQKALEFAQKVYTLVEKENLGLHKPVTLASLSYIYLDLGDTVKAEETAKQVINTAQENQYYGGKSLGLLLLTKAYQFQGKYAEAIQTAQKALQISKALGKEHPDVAVRLNELALLYWDKGDINRATDFYTRGLNIEEKNLQLIYAIGSEQEKQNYAQTFTKRTDAIVTLALQHSSKNPNLSQLAATTVIRRKGRVLDAMTDTVQTLQSQLGNNPEAKKLFDEWINVQQQLAKLVYQGAGEQKFEVYRQQIQRLKAKKEDLENQISRKSAEFRKEITPVELEDIQAQIPSDAAMVEIVQYNPFNPKARRDSEALGKPHYAAMVLRNTGEPKWVDLGDAAKIDESVKSFRRVLAPGSVRSDRGLEITPIPGKTPQSRLQEIARNLDKQVMEPLRPLLGDARHLLLSPDGQLNLIPFEALKDEQNKYLVENYAFSYLTSGRDLLRLETTASQTSPPVVFADIDYKQQDITVAAKTRGVENQRSNDFTSLEKFEPLPATSEEGEQIKKIFPDTNIFTGKQATEGVIKKISTPNILHLATHGFFLSNKEIKSTSPSINQLNNQFDKPQYVNLENPLLRSGLALAGFNNHKSKQSSNKTEDGVLTALEVAGLNLRGTELVVLSACETGIGEVKTGDGVYGLRRALVIAGSQTQLLSLWSVEDNGTKDLMVKYYQKIKDGKGRHEALREVQLEFINNPKKPEYERPYYWASFIPSGSWRKME